MIGFHRRFLLCLFSVFLLTLLLLVAPGRPASAASPETENFVSVATPFSGPTFPPLNEFIDSVRFGQADVVTGVYVPGVLALRVVQQPSGQNTYVSTRRGLVTQFKAASRYGTTGLLAHNYLSGIRFFRLRLNQQVILVYGNGRVERYSITGRHRFRALTPTSPYSSFVDLDGGGRLSSTDVFNQMYGEGDDRVVFQTCIRAYGESAWGRLFVIAEPVR